MRHSHVLSLLILIAQLTSVLAAEHADTAVTPLSATSPVTDDLTATDKRIDLPQLSHHESWLCDSDAVTLTQLGDYLQLSLAQLQPNDKVLLRLRQPLDIPPGMELAFIASLTHIYELSVQPVIRDRHGNEFALKTASRGTERSGHFIGGIFIGNGLTRIGEAQVQTPGLKKQIKDSYTSLTRPGSKPEAPFTLLGLQVWTRRQQVNAPKALYFIRDFAFTRLDHHNSELYYQFQGQECFVELQGRPAIRFSDFNIFEGERFLLDWEIRDQFTAQPFLTGGSAYHSDASAIYPLTLQLSRQTVNFNVTKPGVYWIRSKLRAFRANALTPVRIENRDFRLYIISSDLDTEDASHLTASQSAPAQRIGSSLIRIAAGRSQLIWEHDADFSFNVNFYAAANQDCQVTVSDHSGTVIHQQNRVATSDLEVLRFDLNAVPPGLYTVAASVKIDGKIADRAELQLGRKADSSASHDFHFPPGIATAQQMKDGDALFQIDFHLDRDRNYAQQIKTVWPHLVPITKHFELRCAWKNIETYPGIYDFSELDSLLAEAERHQVKVQLFFHFLPPEWIPPHYTQNPDGAIFGHETYLFHGARLNMYQSPVLRSTLLAFIGNAVLRYRNHPALESYYLLIEHPGEASYRGWYEGFDQFTLENFRNAMQTKYQTVTALNKAWKSDWQSFAALRPYTVTDAASPQFWLDWITFREDAVTSFEEDVLKTIRQYDPLRLIMVYGSGNPRYSKYNIMTANGGCRFPDKFGLSMIKVADLDQGQRAEEVSVSNWNAFYPTHLDTSLFSMLLGGGRNTFCKMFFPVRALPKDGDLTQIRQKNGLDRYEKFMPIWQELRQTDAIFRDIRLYSNTDSFRVQRKSTFHPGGNSWDTLALLDSQLPFWIAPNADWQQAKLVVAFASRLQYLLQSDMDELLRYVEQGGTLLCGVDTGKIRIDDAAEYVMLQQFGFNPPAGDKRPGIPVPIYAANNNSNNVSAVGAANQVTDQQKVGLLRGIYPHKISPGEEIVAIYAKGQTAISRRQYGKGQVYVLWSESNVPAIDRHGVGIVRSYLREIALRHGATIPTRVNSRHVWTNLLQRRNSSDWYLLVMRNSVSPADAVSPADSDTSDKQLTIQVDLPAGNYQISELINNRFDLYKSAADLSQQGLTLQLQLKEVAIFKFIYDDKK